VVRQAVVTNQPMCRQAAATPATANQWAPQESAARSVMSAPCCVTVTPPWLLLYFFGGVITLLQAEHVAGPHRPASAASARVEGRKSGMRFLSFATMTPKGR
jgi:hypothetical protein